MLKPPNTSAFRFILTITGLAIIVVALRLLAPLVSLFLLALFFAIIITPIYHWLQRKGVPSGLAILLVLVGVVGAGLGLALFVFVSFKQLASSLSTYEGLLADQLAGLGVDLSSLEVRDLVDTEQIIRWATGFLTMVGGLAGTGLFIVMVILFAASEANGFYTRLVQSLGASNPLVLRTGQFTQTMVRYVAMRALINLITGGLVALVLLIMGIDFALLWGVLTFFLSFIPYIGIFVATVPSVILAFAQYGLVAAILVIVAVTIINVSAENLVAPKIIGKGLSISPLVVFLSFFFWSWVLGAPGMLLAMPLTVLIIFVLQGFEETQWLAAVVGSPAIPLPATEADALEAEPN